MNWNEYVLRRRIDESKWLASRGITTQEQFLSKLLELGIVPPNDERLLSMFPPEMKNESVAVTPEGIDTSAPRSLVDEGDGSGVLTDGERPPEVPV